MNNFIDRTHNHWKLGLAALKTSGIKTFLRREIYFIRTLFINHLKFYVYRTSLENIPTCQYPELDIICKVLVKPSDVAVLEQAGYDLGPFLVKNDYRLKQGALSICFFQNKTISHVAWIATNQQAKMSLTDIPCRVSIENGEAYLGRLIRNPRLKRPGFSAITIYIKSLEILRENGQKNCSFIILENNIIPQVSLAKRAQILPSASARYLKILWWRWWWEKPLESQPKTLVRYQRPLQPDNLNQAAGGPDALFK
jgi:hypothetical protein